MYSRTTFEDWQHDHETAAGAENVSGHGGQGLTLQRPACAFHKCVLLVEEEVNDETRPPTSHLQGRLEVP